MSGFEIILFGIFAGIGFGIGTVFCACVAMNFFGITWSIKKEDGP